jgi:alkanesulfonate monooxygenase SsuD/methylene tetrahydromethanopterin reductase-like flavin-dependent oxidoreductase (luciferase family)
MWSADAAAKFGLPYAFAHFIDPLPTRKAVEYYRSHFTPSELLAEPRTIVALGAVCADTEEEAQRLLMSARLFRRRIRQGDLRGIPSVEDAIKEMGSAAPPSRPTTGEWPRIAVGTPEQLRVRLIDMASVLHVDELMVVTIVHDHRARMHSYQLLAESFELKPRQV